MPSRIILAGFSFGSAMAVRSVVNGLDCDDLLLIGLPLAWRPIPNPLADSGSRSVKTHIIIGDRDEFCPVDHATAWHHKQQQYGWARLSIVPDAGHFFHKRLPLLSATINETLGDVSTTAQRNTGVHSQ